MRRSRSIATILLLWVIAVGCGQGLDRDAAVDSFQQANPEVTEAQAGCVVDRQIDRLGLDGLTEELVADPTSEAFIEEQFRDMFACGIDGDVESQLVEQLEANGVSPDDAPCVAARITGDLDPEDIDVLVSGEITEAFMAKFVGAMNDCGAGSSGE